jgi:hypothetical protein
MAGLFIGGKVCKYMHSATLYASFNHHQGGEAALIDVMDFTRVLL